LKSPHTKVAIGLLILAVTLSVFTAGCFESSSNTKMEVNEVSPQVNTHLENAKAKIPKAKNVIIFIGDGMGINQVYLANRYSEEVYGKNLTFPYMSKEIGLITTSSLGNDVTDSAAAAVSKFSGYKTKNRMLNMLPNGSIPKKILSEIFKEEGKSVGIVTTTRITHATPAAMYAHIRDRGAEDVIALQMLKFEPTVALGGGAEYFLPKEEGGKRTDGINLFDEFKKKGYVVVRNREELLKVDPSKTDKLLGIFSYSHMAYEIDRENVPEYQNQPSLAEMTEKALEILSKNPKGFILMVEGGRIDHGYHTHDVKAAVIDVKAFDDAIKVALEFQKKHPDTLIIVTADHETGGLSIGRGTCSYADTSAGNVAGYKENVGVLKNVKCSVKYLVHKIIEENLSKEEAVKLIEKMLGFNLTDEEKELLFKYPLDSKITDKTILDYYPRVNEYLDNWGEYALSKIESDRARVYWTAYGHTQNPVAVWAKGPGEELFGGFYDDTELYTKILEASGHNSSIGSMGYVETSVIAPVAVATN
jgi:alkaline phosphatase